MLYNSIEFLRGTSLQTLGKHFLLDLKDCDTNTLNDIETVKATLCDVVRRSDDPPLGESFHQFTPQGVSGLVLGNGSHVCIHTWPEYGYAAVDIFTHNDSFDLEAASRFIIERFGSRNPSVVELKRGA